MLSDKKRKHIGKLHQKKYRKEFDEFVVEGKKGVQEAIESDADISFIVADDAHQKEAQELSQGNELLLCNESDTKKIKATDTFPGILAVAKIKRRILNDIDKNKPVLVLDSVSDPGNLGTIIRTAHWFGIEQLVLSEGTVDVFNPKVVRSTMGSLFHTHVIQSTDIVQDVTALTDGGYAVCGFTMDGESIETLKKEQKTVYIFGSESHGIRQELTALCNNIYTIPGADAGAESLNVAVAAGIIMHTICQI